MNLGARTEQRAKSKNRTLSMKVHRNKLAAVMVLAGLLAAVNVTLAQNTNSAPKERRGPTVQQRVERMSAELQLTDDQKGKVTTLLQQEAKQRREMSAETNLTREERRDKMRALMEDQNKQLKGILTPQQFEKWQTMREQMRARRPGGPGQAGGSADAAAPAPAPAPAPEPKSPDNKAQ
jgi:hypothetical protein